MKSSIEQFGDWFNWTMKPAMEKHDASFNDINVCYVASWHAWQASRAAIEIELPAVICDMSEDGSQHYDRDEVVDAIQSVGIKVKS